MGKGALIGKIQTFNYFCSPEYYALLLKSLEIPPFAGVRQQCLATTPVWPPTSWAQSGGGKLRSGGQVVGQVVRWSGVGGDIWAKLIVRSYIEVHGRPGRVVLLPGLPAPYSRCIEGQDQMKNHAKLPHRFCSNLTNIQ